MIGGHRWTIVPRLVHALRGHPRPWGEPWSGQVDDPRWGRLRLTGRWKSRPSSGGVVIFVHGLGGSIGSHYVHPGVSAWADAGWDVLALNLRGGDRSGEDLYHAGLIDDVAAAAASPEVAGRPLVVCGVSLGGHVALRYAALSPAPTLRAAVAVCSPLDLHASQRAIDRHEVMAAIYRRYLLGNLVDHLARVLARRELPIELDEVRRARTIREFDRLVVIPRFGFESPEDYYARMSVAPVLDQLRMPALLVAADQDPIVTAAEVQRAARAPLEVAWAGRGGHAGFPADLDLGLGPRPGLWQQVLAWVDGA
jgi:predicted alpha/beta-fold hydrolase